MDDIQSKIEQMRGLIATIKKADTAYFRDDRPIMSDRDYDVAVDLLKNLENYAKVFEHMSTNLTAASQKYEEVFRAAENR